MIPLKEIFLSIRPIFARKKEREYYEGVIKDEWQSNEEAGKAIWPNTTANNRNVYLSRLKRAVLERIIEKTLKVRGENPYQRAYFDCWRKLAAVHILNGMGVRRGATWLARKTLKKAIRYDLTEIAGSLSMLLEINESISGDPREFNKYAKSVDYYRSLFEVENKAIRYFTRLSSNFSKSREMNKELVQRAAEYVAELRCDLERYPSFQYTYYTYNIMAIHAQMINDHQALERICENALAFFAAKPYPIPKTVKFSFTFKPISAAIQLRDYPSAHKHINDALEMVQPSSYNQMLCLIYQAILGFHSDNYHLVQEAIANSSARRKYPMLDEQWRIIEAYANLLDINTGQVFRVSRFLNEVPIFSKDKRGNNIAIIGIQILFHLKFRERGKLIDKIEALQAYAYRYLRRDETFRSNCFIHMLLCIPKVHFHPVALQRHAKKYTDRLGSYQGGEVEVIPYEKLWEIVLIFLQRR